MAATQLTSQSFKRDPFPVYRQFREQGPLIQQKIPFLGNIWLTTTYASCTDLLKQTENFCVDGLNASRKSKTGLAWLPKSMQALTENMLGQDDPDHRRTRRLVDMPFRRVAIDTLRPAIERQTHRLLDKAIVKDGDFDFVTDIAKPLPLLVICDMLGLPESDVDTFIRWIKPISSASSIWSIFGILGSLGKMTEYLRAEFEACRKSPKPGLISELVHAHDEGEKLSDDELLATVVVLFIAGHETTTHLLSSGVWTLFKHNDARSAVIDGTADMPRLVDELLRYNSPVFMTKPRFARQDMEFRGQALKKGTRLMALQGAANIDPAVYEAPETLQIDRTPNRHLTFGHGPHLCLGLHLARAEAEIAFQCLFERMPDIAPRKPLDEMKWYPRIGIRGLMELPVRTTKHAQPQRPISAAMPNPALQGT